MSDDKGPLAVFSFTTGPDETYSEIVGVWHSDANYYVIHRVAAVRGRAVARAIFSFSAERANYLRCDTHEDNAPMRRALESFGFQECGTITVANGTERVAYDWMKEAPRDSTHGRNTKPAADASRTFACNFPPTQIDDTSETA